MRTEEMVQGPSRQRCGSWYSGDVRVLFNFQTVRLSHLRVWPLELIL